MPQKATYDLPEEKYKSGNYEQIGRIILEYSGSGLVDLQQFARRLLANILLANGDRYIMGMRILCACGRERAAHSLQPIRQIAAPALSETCQ